MIRIVVVTGNISSGKSTLSKKLANWFGVSHISSDSIRDSILMGEEWTDTSSTKLFKQMLHVALTELNAGRNVVLDSTGMSPAFRYILRYLEQVFSTYVVRLECDPEVWEDREVQRTDRGKLGREAFERSAENQIEFNLLVDTSDLRPHEVFETVVTAINEHNRSLADLHAKEQK